MPTGDPASKRKAVRKIFDEAAKHVATVQVSADPVEAVIAVDGKSKGAASALGGPLFLAPGKHTIEASAKGYQTQTTNLDAKQGAEQTVTLNLKAVASAVPASTAMPGSGLGKGTHDPAPQPPADTGTKQPPTTAARPLWPALLGGGVAIAGLGAGIGFSLAASSASSDHDSKLAALGGSNPCGAGTPNVSACAEINSLDSKAARDRNIATAGFIVGGVSAIATVTYLLWPRSEASGASAHGRLHVDGAIQPGFAAIRLGGSF